MNMLCLVRKTNVQSYRFLTTTPKFWGGVEPGDTTEVSYEEAKPYSSIPSPFSLPIIGNGYLLKMKHARDVPYGKQISLLHHDLTQNLQGLIFWFQANYAVRPREHGNSFKK